MTDLLGRPGTEKSCACKMLLKKCCISDWLQCFTERKERETKQNKKQIFQLVQVKVMEGATGKCALPVNGKLCCQGL